MGWLYVPGMAALSLDSGLRSGTGIDACVASSGTLSPRPLSWRGWRTRGWIVRLCGTICAPSRADAGVDAWILSLRGTRASRSVSPGASVARAIHGICGRRWPALLARYSRHSVFSRTCGDTSTLDLIPCSTTFADSATAWKVTVESLSSDYSARRNWARRTIGAGCSSSQSAPMWPTAGTGADQRGTHPTVEWDGKKFFRKSKTTGTTFGAKLDAAAEVWPTPAGRDHKGATGAAHLEAGTGRKHLDQLPNFVAHQWQTPTPGLFGTRGGDRNAEQGLKTQAKNWATPQTYAAQGSRAPGQVALDIEAKSWATPMGMDGVKPSAGKRSASDLSPQAQGHSGRGAKSSGGIRRLNPLFVEWLMGWPIGRTGCGAAGMESFRSWRRRHLPVFLAGIGQESCRE